MSLLAKLFGRPASAPATTPALKINRTAVIKAYQEHCFPVLQTHGFDAFEGTAAWRYRDKVIDAVDITFFPSTKTRQWGISQKSFALSGGVFFPFVPHIGPASPVGKDGRLRPPEIACTDRKSPLRRMKQRHNQIPNIWHVADDGANLQAVMAEVRVVLEVELIPHLNAQGDLRKKLAELIQLRMTLKQFNPGGFYHLGFFALELGEWQLAKENLQKALATGFYGDPELANPTEDQIRAAIHKAEDMLKA